MTQTATTTIQREFVNIYDTVTHRLKQIGERKLDLIDHLKISYMTLKKYLHEPGAMTGETREKMREFLKLTPHEFDEMLHRESLS